jgi:Flp pilus assembly protein TadD
MKRPTAALPLCLLGALAAAAAGSGCARSLHSAQDDAAFGARKTLTRALLAREDWANAFAHAAEMHRQHPDDVEVLTLRGILFRERKFFDEAEADLQAALRADDKCAEAHAALGILYDLTSKSEQADRHHRRAVALDGNNAAYLNNLGFSLLVRHKPREALEVLQRSARLDPTNIRLRTNLGFAYAATGDLPRAAREFDRGASPAEARNNLGFAYEARGDLVNAYDLYVQALSLDPACARARGNLRHVAARLGRPLPPELAAAPAAPAVPDAASPSTPRPENAP